MGSAQRQRYFAIFSFCICLLLSKSISAAEFTDSVRFFYLDNWATGVVAPDSATVVVEPPEAVARALAWYFAVDNSRLNDFAALDTPLQIINPYDLTTSRGVQLYDRTVARLRQYGIAFTVSYPESFEEAEQTVARHIAAGFPVIALHPNPYLLLGFDYREPDPWWYLARFVPEQQLEFVTRSEWRAGWWLWEADPTAMALLEITGVDSTAAARPAPIEVFKKILI